ncbi:MAG: ATP-binding protein [Acidobacteriota bacterium]|nr:ATP-binding protein [Acidobacteriota bacterium]
MEEKRLNPYARLILFASVPPGLLALIVMLQAGMSLYLTGLVAVVLAVLISACALTAARRATTRQRTVANLLEAVMEGDTGMRGKDDETDPVYSGIIRRINSLTDVMARYNVRNRERELLLSKISDRIDVAVLAVDEDERITLANPAAVRLIGEEAGRLEGNSLRGVGLQSLPASREKRVMALTFRGTRGDFYVYSDEFMEHGSRRRLIFITDIQRILREEERKAWQSLLRVLSHEINNTLTPIASISDTLTRLLQKREDGGDLTEGLSVIKERAAALGQFIERYKQFARLPKPEKRIFVLEPMLQRLAALFPHRTVTYEGVQDLTLEADPAQMEQVLVNLFKNADEAMPDPKGKIVVSCRQSGDYLQVVIQDEGIGIGNRENLFVPFYTTKEGGSGIGLALCRQIAFQHGGELILRNRKEGKGTEAALSLPHGKNDQQQPVVE